MRDKESLKALKRLNELNGLNRAGDFRISNFDFGFRKTGKVYVNYLAARDGQGRRNLEP